MTFTTAEVSVLQVVTSTHRRGAETFAMDLGTALARRMTSVRTVALEPGRGAATLPIPALADSRGTAATRALRREMADVDVVIAHGSATLGATAAATLRASTRPTPPFVYRLIGDPTYWSSGARRRLQVGALLHRASAVATYHRRAADELVGRYRLPAAKVHVIPKGIDPSAFPPVSDDERRAARDHLGVGDGPVVAWIGALSPEKDPGLAVETARLAGVTLLLAGDGPMRGELPTSEDVRVLGATDSPRSVLIAADALLLTSRTEGVPGVVLEAGLCGLPVVTVDVGGVADLLADECGGRVVPDRSAAALAEALTEVLGSPAPGAGSRNHILRIANLDQVAERWAELLAAVSHR